MSSALGTGALDLRTLALSVTLAVLGGGGVATAQELPVQPPQGAPAPEAPRAATDVIVQWKAGTGAA